MDESSLLQFQILKWRALLLHALSNNFCIFHGCHQVALNNNGHTPVAFAQRLFGISLFYFTVVLIPFLMAKTIILGKTIAWLIVLSTSFSCVIWMFSSKMLKTGYVQYKYIYIYVYFNTCGQMLQVVKNNKITNVFHSEMCIVYSFVSISTW